MHHRRRRSHSYGEVEDCFFERYPDDAALLQVRYGHRWREGNPSTNQFSMFAYLAGRLRDLAREEAVQLSWARPKALGRTTESSATGLEEAETRQEAC